MMQYINCIGRLIVVLLIGLPLFKLTHGLSLYRYLSLLWENLQLEVVRNLMFGNTMKRLKMPQKRNTSCL